MGPRSLDRGNRLSGGATASTPPLFNGAAISRSRKWFRPAQAIRAAGSLQWGRDLSIAEIEPVAHSKIARPAGLQWGRDLSIAEICRVTKARESGRLSSMGPRSLDRGNPPACRLGIKFQVLFNGAAISRSRKWFDSTFHVREDIILQWGRDLSIAEICGRLDGFGGNVILQWGRDLSIAEM